jgi:hypothetical protein
MGHWFTHHEKRKASTSGTREPPQREKLRPLMGLKLRQSGKKGRQLRYSLPPKDCQKQR